MQATLTTSAYRINKSTSAQEIADNIKIFKAMGGNIADLPSTVFPMWYWYGYISKIVFELVVEQGLELTHNYWTLTGVRIS